MMNKPTNNETIEKLIVTLEEKHLIRAEWRSGAKWYEITHDRLISPIKIPMRNGSNVNTSGDSRDFFLSENPPSTFIILFLNYGYHSIIVH
jgi:hypothetical protein